MNNIIFLIVVVTTLSCNAQISTTSNIIPLENKFDYHEYEMEIPDGTYFKDVNNKLDPFVGTWLGNYNGKIIELFVVEYIYNSTIRPLSIDELLIRYKITDPNGTVIVDTTNLPDDSPYVMKGTYFLFNRETYELDYGGYECGQDGDLLLTVVNNGTQMNFKLILSPEIYCPENNHQSAPQVLPTETIVLDKK